MSLRVSPHSSSGDGPTIAEVGVITQEYVETPYGVGRIVLPHVPRADGIVVVQLPFGVLHTGQTMESSEDSIKRLENYKQLEAAAVKAAKAVELAERKAEAAAIKAGKLSSSAEKPKKKIDFPKIDFSPLNVPMYRRRQTLALALSSFWSLVCVAVSLAFIRSSGILFYLFLAYVVWMLLLQEYHKNGRGFKSDRFRRMVWWKWFRDYFPISLHATAPLDPQGKYIFCYHPHGILSLGAFLNFGSEATGFSEKFPGINLNVLTLTANFRIPFYGFFLSLMGIADASRESCNACLGRGPGSAILLVLGGAKESLDAHPHRDYELTLFRKGYVKVALENGADLVPVFSFGETDVWDQVENPRGSTLRKLQDILQKKLGFAFPLVKGRGIWNYSFGLLPHRRPISTFVGPALKLPRVTKAEITDELIAEYHELYKAALEDLFNKYKATFAPHRKLHFVEEPVGARGRRLSILAKKEQ